MQLSTFWQVHCEKTQLIFSKPEASKKPNFFMFGVWWHIGHIFIIKPYQAYHQAIGSAEIPPPRCRLRCKAVWSEDSPLFGASFRIRNKIKQNETKKCSRSVAEMKILEKMFLCNRNNLKQFCWTVDFPKWSTLSFRYAEAATLNMAVDCKASSPSLECRGAPVTEQSPKNLETYGHGANLCKQT